MIVVHNVFLLQGIICEVNKRIGEGAFIETIRLRAKSTIDGGENIGGKRGV